MEADGTKRISKKVAKFEAIARLKAVLENEKDHFKFCIDLQFESLMIEKELTHLARQLSRTYGFNKTSEKPCHLTLGTIIYYVHNQFYGTKINLSFKFFTKTVVFFVKSKEFLFQHYILTKFSYCILIFLVYKENA